MFWFGLTSLLLLIIVAIISLFAYAKYIFGYWKRHNIMQLNPVFPYGDAKEVLLKKKSQAEFYRDVYKHFKLLKQPVGGAYFSLVPLLIVNDLELIKNIMVKDFIHFTDRDNFCDEKVDFLTNHLFNMNGVTWRNMRAKLTPTFTSGKMKMMFNTVIACSDELNNVLNEKSRHSEPLDIKDYLDRYTTDVIGSCAFGINCNSLTNPETEFKKYCVQSFEPKGIFDKMRLLCAVMMPSVLKIFKIPVFNRNIANFFKNVVGDTVRYREENNIIRKDFMHLLLQLKNQGKISNDDFDIGMIKKDETVNGLTLDQIVAQCFLFFLAGFETSSSTMTFCLYEMTKNPDIQEKVRKEVRDILKKYNGQLTYDGIIEMKYMDKVIDETLRKYPVGPFFFRRCTKDYKLPEVDCVIKKGTRIRIPVLGIHRDPEYYPNPEKFDPERFTEEEKAKRHPSTYMPFGDGPRNCIGLRFGVMETKIGIAVVLNNYKLTLNNKTQEPLQINPNSIIMSTVGRIWLDAEKIGS